MLESFLQNHDDLFLRTSISIEGFDIKVEDENIYNLFYVEKDKMSSFDKKDLLNVYPDYCIIFGDLVQEVLTCVKDWIDSGVYSTARIGVTPKKSTLAYYSLEIYLDSQGTTIFGYYVLFLA